jgi:hypothetical protein
VRARGLAAGFGCAIIHLLLLRDICLLDKRCRLWSFDFRYRLDRGPALAESLISRCFPAGMRVTPPPVL